MFKKKKKFFLESMINTCLTVGTNKKKTRKIAFMMIYGDFICVRPVYYIDADAVEGLPCFKMAALLTQLPYPR